MRILVLVTDAHGGHGGIAKFNRDLLSSLVTYPDCEEIVAIPRVAQSEIGLLPKRLKYEVTAIGGKLNYLKVVAFSLFRKPQFNLIICAHINLLPIAYFAQIVSRSPLMLIGHGIDIWQPTGRVITDWCAKRINVFVAVSDLTRRRFINWTQVENEKTFVIPNSIDSSIFSPGIKNSKLIDRYELAGKRVILTFGRLAGRDREKGFDEVLEALPLIIKCEPDLVYVIAGSGPDLSRLAEKAEQLGVIENVRFTGYVQDSEKVDIFRLADAYIMPSRGEGFGIVLLEAMACGIPVVASSADGSKEAVLNGKLGEIVDPKKPAEVEKAILNALNKPISVPSGLEYFSTNNFTWRLHNVIDSLIN